MYESPVTKVIEVSSENRILDGSVQATRNGYGAAKEETWD